jgi:hypothetical protein
LGLAVPAPRREKRKSLFGWIVTIGAISFQGAVFGRSED